MKWKRAALAISCTLVVAVALDRRSIKTPPR
jgi:hypothetical protein